MNTLEQKISQLLLADNSLQYNKEEMLNKFVEGVTEIEAIALTLCGTSGEQMCIDFMTKGTRVEDFLLNVSFNGERSNPFILRAIQIHLQNL